MLRTLHQRGTEFLRAGRFDPLTHMTSHQDPGLVPDRAVFLGVTTSTVTAHHAGGAHVRSWRALATLTDGTELDLRVPDIDDYFGLHGLDVASTTQLTPPETNLITVRPWRWQPPSSQPSHARVGLRFLHSLITEPHRHRNVPAQRR